MNKPKDRLDASETIFFERELEAIDSRVYEIKFPLLKGRMLVPKVKNVGPNDKSYTYRMTETFGKAEWIADGTKVFPKVQAQGREYSAPIKELGLSYGYGLFEIRASQELGRSLDDTMARGARRGTEEFIDEKLAFGDSDLGMTGFANHSTLESGALDPGTKAAGGTEWLNSDGSGKATAREMVADVNYLVNDIWAGLKEAQGLPDRVTVVIPAPEYAYLSTKEMGDNADKTALRFLLDNNSKLAEIVPWHKLTDAAGGGVNRAIGYIKDPDVLGAVIAMEYTPQPVQQTGIYFEVPTVARCGGTVWRYLAGARYMDGI